VPASHSEWLSQIYRRRLEERIHVFQKTPKRIRSSRRIFAAALLAAFATQAQSQDFANFLIESENANVESSSDVVETTVDSVESQVDQTNEASQASQASQASEAATSDSSPSEASMDQLLENLRDAESRLESLEKDTVKISEAHDETEERLEELLDAQEKEKKKKEAESKEKKWFEKYTIRGYGQLRFNEVLNEEEGLGFAEATHAGDSSVGEGNNTFLVRRARVIISGDPHEYLSIYLQPDFASTPNSAVDQIEFAQLRDWYADVYFDKAREYRVRVGQSKVPYGWENLQSSSNRLPLDRNDAFNSATRNERDLGAFFYWTPEYAQDLFKRVVDDGLKGSGNYGVFGLGVHAGQGGSLREQNDGLHVVSRLAVPYEWESGQITEFGVQAYTGMYSVLGSTISPLGVGPAARPDGTVEEGNERGIVDKRIGATYVYYPQPLGFQSEWTVGRGPGLNDAQTAVTDRPLYGGYVMTMYREQTESFGDLIPFTRWSYFQGGYKSARNAPFAEINELEVGLEWQFTKYLELVSMYTVTDRTNLNARSTANTLSYGQFDGDMLRFQLQFNY
jgi:Phosphate-selective porin O and P